ncbi:MAG: PQQ-binding-like beta-propeller repeat protein [Limisphaerales bacterium]
MKSLAASLPLLLVAPAALSAEAEWPMFRGPNASGVSLNARPPLAIGPTNLVAWQMPVPGAPSSPVVAGDRLFLTAFAEGKLQTRGYSAKDGSLLWTAILAADKLEEFHATEGSPAAASPATDGATVVSYFGSAGLAAYDANGRERWTHRLPVAVTSGNFGSGTSPLIHDGKVFLNRDQTRGSLILALSLKDGKRLWETSRPESPTSFGSPIVWTHSGVTEIVASGALSMRAYDPATGAERWVLRGLPSFTCTTPVLGQDLLFFAGWSPGKADSPWPTWESTVEKADKNGDGWIALEEFEDGPAWFKAQDLDGNGRLERADWEAMGGLMKRGENVLLAVKPGGAGDVSGTHVAWRFTRGLPYVPSPLYYDGRVYLIRDGGMASSFNAATGEPYYTQERIGTMGGYYASPVAADGRLYLASLQGVVSVLKAGGGKPEILHRADFGEKIAATPALAGRRLYLRTESKLYAFEETALAAR